MTGRKKQLGSKVEPGSNAAWFSQRLDRISSLDAYVKPEKIHDSLKLDSNENFALDGKFISDIAVTVAKQVDLREYPLTQFEELYARLANYAGVDEKYIAVGNGSDQIIELILSTVGAGRRATVLTPSFSYFTNRCRLHDIQVDQVPLTDDFNLDVKEFLRNASKADIAYICSPNNPTGNQLDRRTMTEIIESLDGKGKLLLVDEAYVDFAEYSLSREAVARSEIVVLRTLSKAFGLAGARVGYMISSERFVNLFRTIIQSPYPVSSLSLQVATSALSHLDAVRRTIKTVREERERIASRLARRKGFRVFRSDTNFVLFEAGDQYAPVLEILNKHRISIKALGDIGAHRGCFRVTVGTRRMNDRFLRSIEGAA